MSTQQYPEVSGEDSGLVPPQSHAREEWPKKIRTLSAVELDRLTIDADGRFYWDGRLVNYQAPDGEEQPNLTAAVPDENAALAMLDRAAHDISRHGPAAQTADSAAQPTETHPHDAHPVVVTPDQSAPSEAPKLSALVAAPARSEELTTIEHRPASTEPATVSMSAAPFVLPSDRFRLKLSFGQALALALITLSVLTAAAGLAAQGLVSAHEWGCRNGMTEAYCPKPPPAPAPPPRFDVPA
jgi:hypothetical protein